MSTFEMKDLYTLKIKDVGFILAPFIICDNFYMYLLLYTCERNNLIEDDFVKKEAIIYIAHDMNEIKFGLSSEKIIVE